MKLFRLWLGITEYLYRNEELLNECIETGLTDNTFVSDDLEFTFAARVRMRPIILDQLLTYDLGLERTSPPRQHGRLPREIREDPKLLRT